MRDAVIAKADALCDRLYAVALSLPLVLLALLLIGALAGPAAAKGKDIAPETTLASCGKDLRSTLSKEQKEAIAETTSETIAGEGLFWKIEKEGVEPSYLLGTIHLPDPRVVTLPKNVAEAIDNADRTVLELAEIADPTAMAGIMFSMPDIMMLPGDETLDSILSAEDYKTVSDALAKKSVPISAMNKMQPWFISASMAMPDCPALPQDDPSASLDPEIAKRALADGQEVLGLETVQEQLSVLSSMPIDTQVVQLVSAMEHIDVVNDMMETMVGLYVDEQTGAIMPTLQALFPNAESLVGGNATFAAFEDAILDNRNLLMTERMIPFLEEGNSFVAVGALHLIGETGIVNGLREKDWTVTRVDRVE
ncbi:TraB/GumN family protein [Fulvimarina sp. MAC3]|uniref:TraB/GumN family protein n=1 Tax=Fulvimarina sp. MAC3 TaxID=3148887 RepID=UPI0031FD51CA